jgi:hypothetical protein
MPLPEWIENVKKIFWCKGFLDENGNAYGIKNVDGNLATVITDGINVLNIDSNGRAEITQHAHADQGNLHFDVVLSEGGEFILIDLSDTNNYPHSNLNYIHLEWLRVQIDAGAGANYELEFGFLENVDENNSNLYIFEHIKGTQQTGTSKELFFNYYPNGGQLRSQKLVTHDARIDDETFQNDQNNKSTLNPSTANVAPGNGDFVLLVTRNAGTIDVVVGASYHSH